MQRRQGLGHVVGERVVAEVGLDGVQRPGQVVVDAGVAEDAEVGAAVQVRVAVDAGRVEPVVPAGSADGGHEQVHRRRVRGPSCGGEAVAHPCVLAERGDQRAAPVEQDGPDRHAATVRGDSCGSRRAEIT